MPDTDSMEGLSLEQAEKLRADLTDSVQSIQAQLGDKQRTDESGRRLTSREYWAWKRSAQHALNTKLSKLRSVKQWIKERRAQLSSPRVDAVDNIDPAEALGHLLQVVQIINSAIEDEVDFEPEEVTQIDAARNYLRRIGVTLAA